MHSYILWIIHNKAEWGCIIYQGIAHNKARQWIKITVSMSHMFIVGMRDLFDNGYL